MTTETKPAAKKGNKKTATAKATAVKPVAANVLTVEQLHQALMNANAGYIARAKAKGVTPDLNEKGFHESVNCSIGALSKITDVHLQEIAQMGLNDSVINCLSDATNIKKTKRICQALMFTLTGNGNYLKMSAKSWFLGYCGMIYAGAKTREGVRFCITGKGDEHTSDQVRSTEKARKILTAFNGGVSPASEPTTHSVAFSSGGIAEALQCAKKGSRKDMPQPNLESPVLMRLDKLINTATDGYIELLVAQSNKK